MDGIINIWKPQGFTSHDVVARIRRILKMKRVGHTGTLDPMAQGVLPVCTGKGTNSVEMITASEKTYVAVMTLGTETNTQDATGEITRERPVCCTEEDIAAAAQSFVGEIEQIPPMYSAVHHNGRRLYQLARQGIEVERKPRRITVYSINVLRIDGKNVKLQISCSKGTYIRTLCFDIGERLGCGAHMAELTRTRSGIFTAETAVTLEKFEENPTEYLIPVCKLFEDYPKILLSEADEKKVRNGVMIEYPFETGKTYTLFTKGGDFLCISEGITINNRKFLKMTKSFY